MSVKGTGTVRTETQANIQTNTSNLISGDDVQEAIVNALDSLSKDTYVDTIPYEIGESVIFDVGTTKKIYLCVAGTTPGESPSTHPAKWTDILETVLSGDITIGGNLIVEGNTVVNETENVLIGDNHLYLNNGYKTVATQTGGLVVNYLPTATNDTVAAGGFTAGVAATSNPTVATTGAATFSAGEFIQIDGASEPSNNGLFEVLSHAANVLTIRGIGTTARVEDFTQNQFVTDTTVSGTITKVNVSVLRAGTDGSWETASGSSTGLTFSNITGDVSKTGTPVNNQVAVWTADGIIEGTGGLLFNGSQLTLNGVSNTLDLYHGYIRNTVDSTIRMLLYPTVSDGASAIAYKFDTENNLTNANAKLFSLLNQGIEKFYIDKDGNTNISGTLESEQTMHIAKAEVLYTDTVQTTIITLPANAVVWDIGIEVVTAFNDSGTDYLDIITTSTADAIINDYVVSSLSFTNQLLSSRPYKVTTSTNITFQYTGQNSDATQGQAFVYIHYSLH